MKECKTIDFLVINRDDQGFFNYKAKDFLF